MQKSKNIKIFIGLFYLIALCIFLYVFFSKFTIEEITTYKFIQVNREYLINFKESNIILLTFIFSIFIIIWIFLLGFGSPIVLMTGFIFGKWFGLIIATSCLSIGSLLLYIFGNYYFKDLIRDKFLNKFKKLEVNFKNNEFIFFLVYRFVGGIPFPIANLLPVLFNVSIKNYFFGTFLGLMPQLFIMTSLGSGIEKIIKNNETVPSVFELIKSSEIYMPILGFIFILIISIILKKFFYKS